MTREFYAKIRYEGLAVTHDERDTKPDATRGDLQLAAQIYQALGPKGDDDKARNLISGGTYKVMPLKNQHIAIYRKGEWLPEASLAGRYELGPPTLVAEGTPAQLWAWAEEEVMRDEIEAFIARRGTKGSALLMQYAGTALMRHHPTELPDESQG